MGNFNQAIIMGNLCADPKLNETQTGKKVCNFRVATNEYYADAAGEKRERVEYHNVVCWDKLAANCGTFLAKGKPVLVSGRLQTREWEKDGHKHYTTEIVATTVQFIGPKTQSASAQPEPADDYEVQL